MSDLYNREKSSVEKALFDFKMIAYTGVTPSEEFMKDLQNGYKVIEYELYKQGLARRIIYDKYELGEKKEWYNQLKYLDTYEDTEKHEIVKTYTNYMNLYHYVYDMNNELIRIEVRKYEEKEGE